ncbi:hypothetical protein G5I_11185 [Acromyrmex echinatior]|uniref:Uncharacterized protein n=1 Tax=Acromyrmex echinatior TaxID=103372 RepID=F4WYX1_ACREC|nr:hypothetical protein G5I_11185 [Acromyrmex echinatior]
MSYKVSRDCILIISGVRVFVSALVQQGNCHGDIRKVEEAWKASQRHNSGATIDNVGCRYRAKVADILSTFLANNALILVADTITTSVADTMPISLPMREGERERRLTLMIGPSLSFRLPANHVPVLP